MYYIFCKRFPVLGAQILLIFSGNAFTKIVLTTACIYLLILFWLTSEFKQMYIAVKNYT